MYNESNHRVKKQFELAMVQGEVQWLKHALQRMLERDISREDVKSAILEGVVIEEYNSDKPYPSVLLARINDRPLHVVVSFNNIESICYIITAYVPDTKYFEEDLITRKKR